jgi:hypothetical protein
LALLLVGATSSPSPAAAAAGPLPQEWWFTTWDVQNKVWPISQGAGVTVRLYGREQATSAIPSTSAAPR